jgi:hypothetical protein
MTHSKTIADFLRGRKPHPFCDQCIADAVYLGSRAFGSKEDHYNPHIAQQIANALGQTRQFRRTTGTCYQCKHDRKVTWAK